MIKATINIHFKNGVLDPVGKATLNALEVLDFNNIKNVNIGKQIIINIDDNNKDNVKKEIDDMCKKLLVNDVIEDYVVELT